MTKDNNTPPQVVQAMGLDWADSLDEEAAPIRRHCRQCEGTHCVEKDMDNIYVNPELNLSINIPAHICSKCDAVIYEPTDYEKLLEAEEKASGRHYTKVEIKNGKISKYSVH
jgi:hypothetical protein